MPDEPAHPSATPGLRLVVCTNLCLEVERVVAQEHLDDVSVHAFPASCNAACPPPVHEAGLQGDTWVLAGGCLGGSARLKTVNPHLTVDRRSHCQSLLCGETLVEHLMGEGAFVVTAGWVLGWRTYVGQWAVEPMHVRDLLGATSLVLLDSQVHPDAPRELDRFAAWLGLPARVLPVGLDLLRLELLRIVERWRQARDREATEHRLASVARQAADQQMLLDMLGTMTRATSIDEARERALDMFELFFPSDDLAFIPMIGGHVQPPTVRAGGPPPSRLLVPAGRVVAVGKRGFAASLLYGDEVLGTIVADGLHFPEFLEAYMHAASVVSRVCALALATASAHQHMSGSIADLTQNVKTLSGLIPICSHCKSVRSDAGYWEAVESYLMQRSTAEFSHSLCPTCVKTHYPDLADQILTAEP